MKITRKQAEDFVHFGEDHYSNLKILKDMIYVETQGDGVVVMGLIFSVFI